MKIFLNILLFIALSTMYMRANAQELIMNGSFEIINYCSEFSAKCSPAGWFFVNQQGPRGFVHQNAKRTTSGKEYLDFMAAAREVTHRTYWQTMLLCPLIIGEEYEISFNIAASNVGPNLNDIGFLFSDQFIHHNRDTILQPASYISFTDATIKKHVNFWFTVTKKIRATTNQQFLVIGNFSSLSNDEVFSKRKFRGDFINLELDDVSIRKLRPSDCANASNVKDSVYSIRARHPLRDNPGAVTASPLAASPVPAAPVLPSDLSSKADTLLKADTIRLGNILFAYDSHILKDTAALLSHRQSFTSKKIKSVTVTGFADDRGSEEYNQLLSLRRAQEVMKLISLHFEIDPAIMMAIGAGRSNTFSDRELNRRVEIYIYAK